MDMVDPIVFRLTIFVLAIFVGYFVVWSVTPALHTPLMSVTNAISSVIVVGALIAVSVSSIPSSPAVIQSFDGNGSMTINGKPVAPPGVELSVTQLKEKIAEANAAAVRDGRGQQHAWLSKGFGLVALILACVNIFGGFLVTARMLAMYKKKDAK
jgi:NAD(P) transhydrogenase subunit alpha